MVVVVNMTELVPRGVEHEMCFLLKLSLLGRLSPLCSADINIGYCNVPCKIPHGERFLIVVRAGFLLSSEFLLLLH